jgi:hypothetical protein
VRSSTRCRTLASLRRGIRLASRHTGATNPCREPITNPQRTPWTTRHPSRVRNRHRSRPRLDAQVVNEPNIETTADPYRESTSKPTKKPPKRRTFWRRESTSKPTKKPPKRRTFWRQDDPGYPPGPDESLQGGLKTGRPGEPTSGGETMRSDRPSWPLRVDRNPTGSQKRPCGRLESALGKVFSPDTRRACTRIRLLYSASLSTVVILEWGFCSVGVRVA